MSGSHARATKAEFETVPTRFLPFDDRLIEPAAELLAQRHQRDRQGLPGLPARFERAEEARRALELTWRRPNTHGIAALLDDRLLGFVLAEKRADTLRGRHAWIHLAGHALATEVPAELYRDLYAAAAPDWLAWGCFDHYAMVSAADPGALDAWLRLGFAYEQVHGARRNGEAPAGETRSSPKGVLREGAEETRGRGAEERSGGGEEETRNGPTGVLREGAEGGIEIRRATTEDGELLARFALIIRRHQAGAPVWGAALPEDEAEIRAGYAGLASNAEWTVWLAFVEGQAVAMQAYRADPPADDGLFTPDRCVNLTVAATMPEAQGRGAGLALTQHGLSAARAAGYRWCSADWRMTNLLASRFWPARGFEAVAYRLVRRVDERVVWAS